MELNANKLLLIGGLGVGGYFLTKKMFGYASLSENLQLRIAGVRVHKIGLDGVTIAVKAAVNNPTNTSTTITKPTITLTSNNNVIGSSDASSEKVQIQKQAVTAIPEIFIKVGLIQVIQLVGSVKWATILSLFGKKQADAVTQLKKAVTAPVQCSAAMNVDGLFIKTDPVRIL